MAEENDQTQNEEVEEETQEETTEETSEEETHVEDDLDEASLKDAKALFKLLKDPGTRDSTVRAMADAAGLLGKNTPETKQEVKEAKKDLLGTLKKSLGPQLEWLADKLAPALEEMLDQERQENKKSVSTLEQNQIEVSTNLAWDKLHEETKGLSRKFEAKMVQLADEIYPAPSQTPLQYLRNLYKIASADRVAGTARQQMAEKINRNSKDAPGRLVSSGVGSGGKQRSGNVSLKDAVNLAFQNLTKGR